MHVLLKKVELIFILFLKPECKFFLELMGLISLLDYQITNYFNLPSV